MRERWSDETEQCRRLEHRRVFLEARVAEYGDERGFAMKEAEALEWALDELAEVYPHDVAKARELVASRPPKAG